MEEPFPLLYVAERAEWRDWLSEHHDTDDAVWLVHFKKGTGQPSIPYEDAVEEAVCFGWIDGKIRRIDDRRYARRFTPRRPGSVWSPSNRKRAKKMIEADLMEPPGLSAVEAAKSDGSWTKGDQSEQLDDAERQLRSALKGKKKALANFDALPGGARREFLRYVGQAKRAETVQRRIEESVRLLKENKRLGMK